MAMIRKQLYIDAHQQRKLRTLAKRWGCAEAEVMRTAIDQLPEQEEAGEARLREAGLLVEPPDDSDLTVGDDLDEMERQYDEWLRQRGTPIGLLAALDEDRGT